MLSITHHPVDETVLRYAAGTLNEGPSLVVATHLSLCRTCRVRARMLEMLGGDMLEALPSSPMSADALAKTLALLDDVPPQDAVAPPRPRSRPELPRGTAWPDVLSHYDIDQWKAIAPGAMWSTVQIPGQSKGQVRLLKVAPGAALPHHGHEGAEYTCVLVGSYADHTGRFAAGDMAEADTEVDHQLIATPDSECVCLIAMEARLRLHL